MVARALKRSVGNRCHGHCLLGGTGDEGKGMSGVGWEGRCEKKKKTWVFGQWCCRPKCLEKRIHGTARWRGVGNVNWRGVVR